jgi:GT2 family glycosyltransferase
MLFSVIIPTCQRNDLLAKCLDCLAPGRQQGMRLAEGRTTNAETLKPETLKEEGGVPKTEIGKEESRNSDLRSPTSDLPTYEVIVTDDGSKSTAQEMVQNQYPWVRWVEGPRKGPAANRNNGAKQAQGEWLVFTDDDCLPDKGFLSGYHIAAMENQADVLEGKTSPTGIRTRVDMECPANETGGYLWSCNMAVKKELFLQMDGFDENFPGPAMEDVEFRTRLLKGEKTIIFVPDALALHPWRFRKGSEQVTLLNASVVYFVGKHSEQCKNFSFSKLSLGLARRLFSHLPRAALHCKGRGWINESLFSVYSTWTLFLAIKNRKRN